MQGAEARAIIASLSEFVPRSYASTVMEPLRAALGFNLILRFWPQCNLKRMSFCHAYCSQHIGKLATCNPLRIALRSNRATLSIEQQRLGRDTR
jgi:hypothetical protein